MFIEYKSSREFPFLFNLVTGCTALFFLGAYLWEREVGLKSFPSLIICLLMIVISFAALTYRNVVKIDMQRRVITKTIKSLFLAKSLEFRFEDFQKIGITKGVNAAAMANIVYFVQLLGTKRLTLPGRLDYDYEEALLKAEELSRILRIPLDAKPKIRLFGIEFSSS